MCRVGATSSRGASHALKRAFRSRSHRRPQGDELPSHGRFGRACHRLELTFRFPRIGRDMPILPQMLVGGTRYRALAVQRCIQDRSTLRTHTSAALDGLCGLEVWIPGFAGMTFALLPSLRLGAPGSCPPVPQSVCGQMLFETTVMAVLSHNRGVREGRFCGRAGFVWPLPLRHEPV